MMDPESQTDWESLVALERFYAADLYEKRLLNSDVRREAACRWWAAIAKVIEGAIKRQALGLPLNPMPIEMLMSLQGIADFLSVGTIPEPVRDVAGRGKPGIGPIERYDIACATAYIQLCKSGIIPDGSPISTIMRHYDIKRPTAQAWARRPLTPAVEDRLSDPEATLEAMVMAGARYKDAQWRWRIGKSEV